MIADQAVEQPPKRVRPDLPAIGAVAILVYFVMVGDPAWREIHPVGLMFHGGLAAALVLLFVLRAPGRADRLERDILLALLLFAAAGVFSQFPRQSFDSILVALVYLSGLFLAREVLARPAGRRFFVVALISLSATLTVLIAVQWLALYLQWWSLADWQVVPPLGMNLPSSPWGHRHDLALLLAMLYPAWWIGRVTPVRATAAGVVGALALLVIIIGGSRMVWFAVAGATALVAAPVIARRLAWGRGRFALLAVMLSGALLLAVSTGLGGPVLERVLGGASLAERTAMWGPLIDAWSDRPLVGYGPGSFPWILQMTGYFDTHSFAPRHPDSALIQLLAEGGVVGVIALVVLVTTVGAQLIKGRSRAASWAIVAFALAALAGNPTDFEFMVALAIGWLAFAVPRYSAAGANGPRAPRRLVRVLSLTALGAVGLAFTATMISNVAYTSARASIDAGKLHEAAESIQMAAALDPGLAIYPRQLGTLHLLSGEPNAALYELERAVGLNPWDDLAWRTLALAYREAGDEASSWNAIEHALASQRSDPTNLLLAVRARNEAGDEAGSQILLSEITQAWPEVVADPAWQDLINDSPWTAAILRSARDRWTRGVPSPEPLTAQPLLLDAMTSGGSATSERGESRLSSTLAAAYVAVMRCDPAAAAALGRTHDRDRRDATYWALAARLAELEGRDPDRWRRIFGIMSGDPLLQDPRLATLNPLHENGARGSSADRWGYRRAPISWPSTTWDLPSPRSGFAHWYLDPSEAVRAAGLNSVLVSCR